MGFGGNMSIEEIVQQAWIDANSSKSNWERLRFQYERWWGMGLCMKFHTHDSIIFIVDEGNSNYRAYKFYNDGQDYRVGSEHDFPGEAYDEALVNL
jgi:hypothetical protein